MRTNILLRAALKPLIPFMMIFGLYVQFHGDYGPGGGFQAGVIFAAAIVLYALVWGPRDAVAVFSRRRLEVLVACGVLLYGAVGFLSMILGGNFLDYDVLAQDHHVGQHWGILIIELGVGITVTAAIASLFLLFVMRGRL